MNLTDVGYHAKNDVTTDRYETWVCDFVRDANGVRLSATCQGIMPVISHVSALGSDRGLMAICSAANHPYNGYTKISEIVPIIFSVIGSGVMTNSMFLARLGAICSMGV